MAAEKSKQENNFDIYYQSFLRRRNESEKTITAVIKGNSSTSKQRSSDKKTQREKDFQCLIKKCRLILQRK